MHERVETEPVATPAPLLPAATAPQSAQAAVMQLQRTVGNRAVTRMLQRDAATLDETDMEALKAYGEVFKLQQQSNADPAALAKAKRAAIVKLALSQVGKVEDTPGPDKNKLGWERLREFYRVACPSYTPAYDVGIRTVGMWPAQQPGQSRSGPWSWCAIFGVWAIHQITGIGWFAGIPIGLGPEIKLNKTPEENAAAVQPGDMIVRREQWQIEGKKEAPISVTTGRPVDSLNHHTLVASVDASSPSAPKVTTINGNGPKQGIYVKTEPLSYYHAFYDALAETDWDKYDKKFRGSKEYDWAIKAREKAGLPGVSRLSRWAASGGW